MEVILDERYLKLLKEAYKTFVIPNGKNEIKLFGIFKRKMSINNLSIKIYKYIKIHYPNFPNDRVKRNVVFYDIKDYVEKTYKIR